MSRISTPTTAVIYPATGITHPSDILVSQYNFFPSDDDSNTIIEAPTYPQPSADSDIAFVEGGGFVFTDLVDSDHIRTDEHGIKHYVPPIGGIALESE